MMFLPSIFSEVLQVIHAEGVLYTIAGGIAGLLGKNAFQKEAARRKRALEVELSELQNQRFDGLNKMLTENSDRITRAELLIRHLEKKNKELEEENSRLSSRLHNAVLRCEQLERHFVAYGHAIPKTAHTTPGL